MGGGRDGIPWLGFGLVLVAAVLVIVLPVTIPTILVGAAATAVLARDRRLGPLPAALLVMLALPYDRAADLFLPEIGGIPLRVQDGVIATGVLLALPRIGRLRDRLTDGDGRPRPIAVAVGLFLLVGAIALVIGLLGDNRARDILRDGRWWVLYAVVLLALATGTTWPRIVRAVLIGTTIFAAVIVAAALLPVFPDGVKSRALDFDNGLLRMQFGNSSFLLLSLAYATWSVLTRPDPRRWAWLLLLVTAGGLSLTRTFIIVAVGVVVLVVGLSLARRLRHDRVAPRWSGLAGVALAGAAGLVLAIGFSLAGVSVTGRVVAAGPGPAGAEDPVDRLLFQSPSSDINSIGRRFATYDRAVDVIATAPILGSGLGQLVAVDYQFGRSVFDTPGFLPNVDDAYLTVGMKAGIVGIVAFAAMLLLPLLTLLRRWNGRVSAWLLPAWLGILGLTVTQSFATTGYGPFAVGLLLVVPSLAYASRSVSRARAHE